MHVYTVDIHQVTSKTSFVLFDLHKKKHDLYLKNYKDHVFNNLFNTISNLTPVLQRIVMLILIIVNEVI